MIQDFVRVLREKIRTDMNNYADDLAGVLVAILKSTKNSAGLFRV